MIKEKLVNNVSITTFFLTNSLTILRWIMYSVCFKNKIPCKQRFLINSSFLFLSISSLSPLSVSYSLLNLSLFSYFLSVTPLFSQLLLPLSLISYHLSVTFVLFSLSVISPILSSSSYHTLTLSILTTFLSLSVPSYSFSLFQLAFTTTLCQSVLPFSLTKLSLLPLSISSSFLSFSGLF